MKRETGNWKLDEGVQGAGKGSVANGKLTTASCVGARRRAGFTLVEMLVVVVIILILLGVVFKMVRPAGLQAAKAQTVARLSMLKAAMEEFYAEYGQYPPVPYYEGVQPMYYEYPWKGGMRPDLTGAFEDQTEGTAPLFRFGLVSFLVKRSAQTGEFKPYKEQWYDTLFENSQWGQHNNARFNQNRDARAVDRWAPFLWNGDLVPPFKEKDVKKGVLAHPQDYDGIHRLGDAASRAYTNKVLSASDGWERQFVYVSPPPHQSYLLFSKGPDGKYDSSDPGNRGTKANKDNIYGDAGH